MLRVQIIIVTAIFIYSSSAFSQVQYPQNRTSPQQGYVKQQFPPIVEEYGYGSNMQQKRYYPIQTYNNGYYPVGSYYDYNANTYKRGQFISTEGDKNINTDGIANDNFPVHYYH